MMTAPIPTYVHIISKCDKNQVELCKVLLKLTEMLSKLTKIEKKLAIY